MLADGDLADLTMRSLAQVLGTQAELRCTGTLPAARKLLVHLPRCGAGRVLPAAAGRLAGGRGLQPAAAITVGPGSGGLPWRRC